MFMFGCQVNSVDKVFWTLLEINFLQHLLKLILIADSGHSVNKNNLYHY